MYDLTKLSYNDNCLVKGAPFKSLFLITINGRFYSTNVPKSIRKYENVDKHKLQILEENKGKSGIYLFRNLNNKKISIGYSTDLRRRFKEYFNINHLLRNKDLVICVALAKYGYSGFYLEIIEYCDKADLLEREQYYLDLLNPDYNILKIAGSLAGFKHSDKTKNKLATIFKGNLNGQNQPTAIAVQVLDIETGKTTKYISARKAAKALDMSNSTVIRKINEKSPESKPYKNRYIFKLC